MDHGHQAEMLHLLKHAGLRNTDQRSLVLTAFLENPAALSHGELERQLGDKLDRVTVYRTLKTFVDKGILHSIPDKKEGSKYALCGSRCHVDEHEGEHTHNHNHLHFTCRICNGTFCLENVGIPMFSLPAGYLLEEANLVAVGLCNTCSGKSA